jgi:hypothetical protein
MASESTRSLDLSTTFLPLPPKENSDPLPSPPLSLPSSELPPVAPFSEARFIGPSAKFANGDPRRISMMTATDTTNGTYCLHDSVSDDRKMDDDDDDDDNSGSKYSFVLKEDRC